MSTAAEAALKRPKGLLTFLRDNAAAALEAECIMPETVKALREHAESLEAWSSAQALFVTPPHEVTA